jgi:hypothetical protein
VDKSPLDTFPSWYSASDVSPTGDPVSPQEYLRTEDAFVAVLVSFAQEAKLGALTVTALEESDGGQASLLKKGIDPVGSIPFLQLGGSISLPELDPTCRLALRELVWCSLEARARFYLHFGHDYSAFIGSDRESIRTLQLADVSGILISPQDTPFPLHLL